MFVYLLRCYVAQILIFWDLLLNILVTVEIFVLFLLLIFLTLLCLLRLSCGSVWRAGEKKLMEIFEVAVHRLKINCIKQEQKSKQQWSINHNCMILQWLLCKNTADTAKPMARAAWTMKDKASKPKLLTRNEESLDLSFASVGLQVMNKSISAVWCVWYYTDLWNGRFLKCLLNMFALC